MNRWIVGAVIAVAILGLAVIGLDLLAKATGFGVGL
jgi:hypothetical protein